MKVWLSVILLLGLAVGVGEAARSWWARAWDGQSRFTLIKVGEEIEVLTIDPRVGSEAVKLVLPRNLEMETTEGRGVWRVEAMARLSEKYGWEWVGESVGDYLGVAITGVWDSLGIWDRLAWQWLIRGRRWQEIKLADTDWVVEIEEPDGQKAVGLAAVWQKKARELFYTETWAAADLQVAIYNTTDVTGLGARFARAVENAGIKVNMIGERSGEEGKCVVESAKAAKKAGSVRWLVRNFHCSWRENTSLTEREVNILVGEEYAQAVAGG